MHYHYPENIILDILGVEKLEEIWNGVGSSENLKISVDFALSHLKSREQNILRNIYQDNIPYRDIGIIYNISAERVRQIKTASISKLRNWYPAECKLFTEGIDAYIQYIADIVARNAAAAEQARIAWRDGIEAVVGKELGGEKDAEIRTLGLNTRIYHILNNAGYTYVSEILHTPLQDLRNIPGMGEKSYFGLLEKLAESGYPHNGNGISYTKQKPQA